MEDTPAWERPHYTPEYREALMKMRNIWSEPRSFRGFRDGDLVQIDLLPLEIKGVATGEQYAEGYITDTEHGLMQIEAGFGDIEQFVGKEVGFGSDTILTPPRGPRMPATLFGGIVVGSEVVVYPAHATRTFYSKYGHPHEAIQHRPFARYGRLMIRGLDLFDIRPEARA